MSFKSFRIVVLLVILLLVVHHQVSDRARIASWKNPLFVAVYPVNADDSESAERFIGQLKERDFDVIERFMQREAKRYGAGIDRPVYVQLGAPVMESPPPPPIGGNFVQRASWIARMRWWRWRFDAQGMDPDIIVLARFFDPSGRQALPHSTGIEQIRIAIANLFASNAMRGGNNVVLTHELLHTVGASDKYDLSSGLPYYPHGFARPDQRPLYPQPLAALMAGRIPLGKNEARQAESLAQVIVGPETAREIGWASRDQPPEAAASNKFRPLKIRLLTLQGLKRFRSRRWPVCPKAQGRSIDPDYPRRDSWAVHRCHPSPTAARAPCRP